MTGGALEFVGQAFHRLALGHDRGLFTIRGDHDPCRYVGDPVLASEVWVWAGVVDDGEPQVFLVDHATT